jgi:hypothetical protein
MTWTGKTAKRIAELQCYLFGHKWILYFPTMRRPTYYKKCQRCSEVITLQEFSGYNSPS